MKPIDMKAAKKRLEQKKHAVMVLSAFDKLGRVEKQKAFYQRADIEQKAKKQL